MLCAVRIRDVMHSKVNSLMNDDEFYHLAAHVDRKLRRKIEVGRFVDLAKLLKKNKSVANRNENGVELVNKDGHSYLIPASNKDTSFQNLRRNFYTSQFSPCSRVISTHS